MSGTSAIYLTATAAIAKMLQNFSADFDFLLAWATLSKKCVYMYWPRRQNSDLRVRLRGSFLVDFEFEVKHEV